MEGFLYQGQLRPVAELDGTGALVIRFVYGALSDVARVRGTRRDDVFGWSRATSAACTGSPRKELVGPLL